MFENPLSYLYVVASVIGIVHGFLSVVIKWYKIKAYRKARKFIPGSLPVSVIEKGDGGTEIVYKISKEEAYIKLSQENHRLKQENRLLELQVLYNRIQKRTNVWAYCVFVLLIAMYLVIRLRWNC